MKLQIDILKVHGSDNDFILIDEITHSYSFTEQQRQELAILLCDRVTGVGADGILYTMKSNRADGRMRVFNSDGSEASMCGNGLRCVARYVCELLNVEEAVIETMKANLTVKKQAQIYPSVSTYLVEISPVSFHLTDLPMELSQAQLINEPVPSLSVDLSFTAVAVPNPHLITIVDKEVIQSNIQKELSEKVNGKNNLFPDGVNVSFVNFLEKGHIYVKTFERGVGFTNACGTAMSASTLVTCLLGHNDFEEKINVYNDGGMVNCVVHQKDGHYSIDLIGNATYVFKAQIQLNEEKSTFQMKNKEVFDLEIERYSELKEFAMGFLSS